MNIVQLKKEVEKINNEKDTATKMTAIVGGLSVEKTHNNSDQKKDDQKETTFHLTMSGKNSEFKVNETSFPQRRDDINKIIEVIIVL